MEEYEKTCVTHSQFGIIYNTVIFTIQIFNAGIKQEDINYYYQSGGLEVEEARTKAETHQQSDKKRDIVVC